MRTTYILKFTLALISFVFSILLAIFTVLYLFFIISNTDPFAYEFLIFVALAFTTISSLVYHTKTFYLITRVPTGESFHFISIKKLYWNAPYIFSLSLLGAIIYYIFYDYKNRVLLSPFELICIILLLLILAMSIIEVRQLKKIYMDIKSNQLDNINEIGTE
ncbi:MAG: hypothetical protein ACI80H_000451 [Pseudoalteromonas distincta]|jgi:hypothetical protein